MGHLGRQSLLKAASQENKKQPFEQQKQQQQQQLQQLWLNVDFCCKKLTMLG